MNTDRPHQPLEATAMCRRRFIGHAAVGLMVLMPLGVAGCRPRTAESKENTMSSQTAAVDSTATAPSPPLVDTVRHEHLETATFAMG